jgi:RNA polymerase sigma-70 factor (ECF subfamily)
VTVAVADLVTLIDPQDAQTAEGRESPHVRALIEAARGGDREAFGDLVALHERIVLRTTLAALRAREDAEDAAQDAFVVAWQKLGGFRGDATFRTWLLTIAWRKALDKRRQRQTWWTRVRTSAPGPDAAEIDPIETLPGSGPDPERTAVSVDLARHVRRAIAGLSPKLRDTLLLAATGEHTYEEIAAILNVPLGTVKWRVAEARRLVNAQVPAARVER